MSALSNAIQVQRQVGLKGILDEELEDGISGELMSRAVTVIPCGHNFNEETVNQCQAATGLCPYDRVSIQRYVPNYTLRNLVGRITSISATGQVPVDLEDHPSEEAQAYFEKGKKCMDNNDHEAAINAFLASLQLSPTFEKAQNFLHFALDRAYGVPARPPKPHKEESFEFETREQHINFLFTLLDKPAVKQDTALKTILVDLIDKLVIVEQIKLTSEEKPTAVWRQWIPIRK